MATRMLTFSTLALAALLPTLTEARADLQGSSGFQRFQRRQAMDSSVTIGLSQTPDLSVADSLYPVWYLAGDPLATDNKTHSATDKGWSQAKFVEVTSSYQINLTSEMMAWDDEKGAVVLAPAADYPDDAKAFQILCSSTERTATSASSQVCGIFHGSPTDKKCVIKGPDNLGQDECDPAAMNAGQLWEIASSTGAGSSSALPATSTLSARSAVPTITTTSAV